MTSEQTDTGTMEKKADRELLMQALIFGGIVILVIIGAIVFT